MKALALLGLAGAVGFGLWLASLHARAVPRMPAGWVRAAHGGAGAVGLVTTLAILAGRGWQASGIVWDAVGLLGVTFGLGLLYWLAWARLGGQRGMVLVVHGAFAASGAAIVAGWILD
jgi:hypothetical protein